jgi:hypothetical protein
MLLQMLLKPVQVKAWPRAGSFGKILNLVNRQKLFRHLERGWYHAKNTEQSLPCLN